MTLETDYQKAKRALRHINSKTTPEAHECCAAHSLAEQLEQLRTIHAVELTLMQKRHSQDQADIVAAFAADRLPPRNRNAKGWDSSIEP